MQRGLHGRRLGLLGYAHERKAQRCAQLSASSILQWQQLTTCPSDRSPGPVRRERLRHRERRVCARGRRLHVRMQGRVHTRQRRQVVRRCVRAWGRQLLWRHPLPVLGSMGSFYSFFSCVCICDACIKYGESAECSVRSCAFICKSRIYIVLHQ
jgi:hypothetical protein